MFVVWLNNTFTERETGTCKVFPPKAPSLVLQVLLLWVRWITGHILTFMIGGPDLIVPLYKGRVPWL